jgi:D-alanine--D-alanine ligase
MHGPYGEDGRIQALLELLKLPYTGSGVLTSALSMDKVQFRRIMTAEQILIPQSSTFTNESIEEIKRTVKAGIGEPSFVIKPSDQGSSLGVSLVHNWHDFSKAVTAARSVSETLLVDRYVKGRELTVGILGTKQPVAMPVTEIIPEGEFFDYNAKYLSNVTKELCPAQLNTAVAQEIQQIAVQVFRIVGGAGFGRVDFILDERNQAFVLEINTIPGLTKASLFPKAAAAHGLTFAQLIQTVIDDALLRA